MKVDKIEEILFKLEQVSLCIDKIKDMLELEMKTKLNIEKENELKEIKYNPDSYLEIGGRCEVCISRNCANCPHVIK